MNINEFLKKKNCILDENKKIVKHNMYYSIICEKTKYYIAKIFWREIMYFLKCAFYLQVVIKCTF